jgi:hypothetical protein
MRKEEDGGGGVEQTVTLPPSFIPPLEIYVKISTVHDEVETAELIQPSTCQRAGTAASTTHGNQGNRAGYFSPTRGTCGQTLSTAATRGRRAHHAPSPNRVRPSLQKMMRQLGEACRQR